MLAPCPGVGTATTSRGGVAPGLAHRDWAPSRGSARIPFAAQVV
jgi:hypothetical protein